MKAAELKKWKNEIKRRIAAFLTVVMVIQTPLSTWAAIEPAAGDSITQADIRKNANYPDAFTNLTFKVGGGSAVGADHKFTLNFDGKIDDEWKNEQYDAFLEAGGKLEHNWSSDADGGATYYDYLDNWTGDTLPVITFTCTFSDVADGSPLFSAPYASGNIITDRGNIKLGSYTAVKEDDKVALTASFLRSVYYRQNISFGIRASMQFSNTYEPGTDITVTEGPGEIDFILTPDEGGIVGPSNTGYKIEKGYVQEGDMGICFIATASVIATPADMAATESVATGSAIRPTSERQRAVVRQSKEKRKAAKASDDSYESDDDYDDFDDFDEDDDFPGDSDEPDYFNGPGVVNGDFAASTFSGGTPSVLAAETGNLAGKIITDQIPDKLTITSITVSLNSGEEETVYSKEGSSSDEACSVDGNQIQYTIPAMDDGSLVTEAVLKIHTRLSDVAYNEYLQTKTVAPVTYTFPNVIYLKGDGNENLAISNHVEPSLELHPPFNKEGAPLASDNKKFQWTLTANLQFSNTNATVYVVDRIEDIENTHMYGKNEEGSYDALTVGDSSTINIWDVFKGVPLNGTNAAACSYEEIKNISKIEAFKTLFATEIAGHESDALLYTYKRTVSSGSGTQTDAILLIPLDLEKFNNQEVKIKYDTEAKVPDYENGDSFDDQYKKELVNDAKILWQWRSGEGVDPTEEFGGADINKTHQVAFSLVKKTAFNPTDPGEKGYNSNDNTITWYFEVNQLGIDNISDLEIVDTFDDTQLRLVEPEEAGDIHAPITLIPISDSSDSNGEIIKKEVRAASRIAEYWDGTGATPPASYYQIIKPAEDADGNQIQGKTQFKLHLSRLTSEEHYYFSLKTEVMQLGGTDGGQDETTIENKASVSATVGDHPVEFGTEADCPVKNTVILKESIPVDAAGHYYDYKNNTVKWRVTIHPKKQDLKLANVVLTDILPTGTSLAAWTGVGYGSAVSDTQIPVKNENGTWTAELTPEDDSTAAKISLAETDLTAEDAEYRAEDSAYSQKKLTFNFTTADSETDGSAIIAHPITFEFTTVVDEKYRKEKLKSNVLQNDEIINKAILTGNLQGSETSFNAWDTAENKALPQPITKAGAYVKTQEIMFNGVKSTVDIVNWQLLVNRTSADIAASVLTDQIKDCMELVPETMKVQAVKLNADGTTWDDKNTVVLYPSDSEENLFNFRAPDTSVTANLKPMDYSGFSCTMPAITEMVSDTKTGWTDVPIASTPLLFTFTTVMVDDAKKEDISNSVSLTGTGLSDKTDDIVATGQEGFTTDAYATAEGVYYTKIKKTSNNKDGFYPLDNTEFKIEKMHTPGNGTGSTTFSDWRTAGTVESSRVKSRVTKADGSAVFMFLKPGEMYKITETKAHPGYVLPNKEWYVVIKGDTPSTIQYPVVQNGYIEEEVGGKTYRLDIHDAGSDGQPHYMELSIANAVDTTGGNGTITFTKKGQGRQLLTGTEFTLTPKNHALRTKTAKAKNGIVKFENVDSNNEYTITETTPPGYKASKPISVKLTDGWDEEESYKSKVVFTENSDFVLSEDNTTGTLTNTPVTDSGAFKKVDQNGDLIKTSITFTVKRRGDGGAALKNAGGVILENAMVIDVDSSDAATVLEKAGQKSQDYYDYLLCPEGLTSVDGIVTIDNFLYGDYKLEEQSNENVPLIDETDLPVVYVRVDESGVFANPTCDSATGKVTDGTKLTETDGSSYAVTNELQYGFVQIHKVLGEKDGSGVLQADKNADDSYKELENISFDIYKDVNGNGNIDRDTDTCVMTLKTGENGRFEIQEESDTAEYRYGGQEKKLITGSYILKEKAASGFVSNTMLYPFTIPKWEGETTAPPTVYLGSETSNKPGTADSVFLNEPIRGPLTVYKKDANKSNLYLDGAEFKVYTASTGGDYVADLTKAEGEDNHQYLLTAPTGEYVKETKTTPKKAYLHADETNGPLKLLVGTYYIEETTAPENYQKLSGRIAVTIGSSAGIEQAVTNSLITKDIVIKKLVETVRADGNSTDHLGYAWGTGFTFTLQEDTEAGADGPVNGQTFLLQNGTSNANGEIKFQNVPVGTYLLSETDVPDQYKYTDSDGTVHWAVEKMPDVLVEVKKDGVTYKKANVEEGEGTINPLTQTPVIGTQSKPEAGLGVYTAADADALLAVYNNYIFGSAAGMKVGVIAGSTATPVDLPDAEFQLKGEGTAPAGGYTLTAKSGKDGTFTFANVPYGEYTLTETNTPDGYATAKQITVMIYGDNVALISEDESENGTRFLNQAMKKDVKFRKVDQNGKPLGSGRLNVSFSVKRIKEPSVPVPDFGTQIFSNDGDGVVTLTGLTYGVYKITENIAGLPIVGDASEFYIKVGNGINTGYVMVEIGEGVDESGELTGDQKVSMELPADNNEFDFSDISARDETHYAVTNRIQYGFVQIHKVLGEEDQDGNLQPEKKSNGSYKELSDVSFDIYKDDDGNGTIDSDEALVMTLTTGTDGKFQIPDNYKTDNSSTYTDVETGMQLITGNYILKEKEVVSGYVDNTAREYPFTIPAWTGVELPIVYLGSEEAEESADVNSVFINQPLRDAVELEKIEIITQDGIETEVELKGAQFKIYAKNASDEELYVADLGDTTTPGSYVLQTPASDSGFTKEDEDGKTYLHAGKDGTLKLLYGTYSIEETKAPDHYQKPDEGFRFTLVINENGSKVSGENTKDNTKLQNALCTQDLSIKKLVEQLRIETDSDTGLDKAVHDGYAWGEGFEFTLTTDSDSDIKGPINGQDFDNRTASTDANGDAEFSSVPVGTYLLVETDVPDAYQYHTSDDPASVEWTVEKMPDMKVTVTADGVTYARVDKESIATMDSKLTDADSVAVQQSTPGVYENGTKDTQLAVYNNKKLGSAQGTKKGVLAGVSAGASVNLAGAGFELKNDSYTMTATSGEEGSFKFPAIPYGTYTLTETSAPVGYTKAESITVNVYGEKVTLANNGENFLNATMMKGVKFRKVDQNGDPLEASRVKTTFSVERIEGPSMPELELPNVSNGEDGVVTLTGLTYGIYKIMEDATAADPAVVTDNPEFYIEIAKGTAENTTKVSIGSGVGTDGSGNMVLTGDIVSKEQNDSPADETATDEFDFSDLTQEAHYAVTNTLKYGFVDVLKTAADDDGSGKLKTTGVVLPGVVFKIYEDLSETGKKDAFDKEVLTAVTGKDGRLLRNADGKYLDQAGKAQDYRLVYGKSYLLHEESLPEGMNELYTPAAGYYPFTIETEELPQTVYIGADSDAAVDPGNFHSVTGSEGAALNFLNGPISRSAIRLEKTDPETAVEEQAAKKVVGAEFDLFVQGSDERVAMLRDAKDGVYTLRPGTETGGYTTLNASGQEYVKKQAVEDEYKLLNGDYYIKETKAPSGYVRPADQRWEFTVGIDGDEIVNVDLSEDFTNVLWKRDIVVEKQVEGFLKDTNWHEPDSTDGTFTFQLIGTPSNAMPFEPQTVDVDVSTGQAVFRDIPSGEYILTEQLTGKLPDGRDMAVVYVQPASIQVKVAENGVSYGGRIDELTEVKNLLKRGSISGQKMTEDENGEFGLAGAVFKLTPQAPVGGEADALYATSEEGGKFKFEELPLGTYELTESEAPEGYDLDSSVYMVTIATAGERVTQGADEFDIPTDIKFVDAAFSSLVLNKTAEVLEGTDLTGGLAGVKVPGEGFEFCISGASFSENDITDLFTEEELTVTGAKSAEAREDGKAGRGLYVVTDAGGQVAVAGLPVGNYKVTEVENEKNDAGGMYVRDTREQSADVKIDHATGKVSAPVVNVSNSLKRAVITGRKTRTDGETPLAGAEIGLFPADAAEYTDATLYRGQKMTTGEDGIFKFADIPYGEYQIRELKAPGGYYLNDTVFKVKVTENGQTVTTGTTDAAGETAAGEAPLVIKNQRRPGGGGGGGNPPSPGTSDPPTGPGVPGEPTEPGVPTEPGEPGVPTEPTEPHPDVPVEPGEGGEIVVVPPDTPPGTDVVVRNEDGETVYVGTTDPHGRVHVDLPPGEYELITIDEHGVPLAQMTFVVPDKEIPDAGDHALPIAMLVVIMLGAMTGVAVILKKRKELENEE